MAAVMQRRDRREQSEGDVRPTPGSGFFARIDAQPTRFVIPDGGRGGRVPIELLEVVLDELDSLAQRTRRGEEGHVPEVTVRLESGLSVRGMVIEYVAWERILLLRTAPDDALRIPARSIAAVVVHLSPANEAALGLRSFG